MIRAWVQRLWILVAILTTTGCYVPQAYQVVNTINPQYEDQDVRFRTTYHLRVFDLCRVDEDQKTNKYAKGTGQLIHRKTGDYRIIKDSLYRFRMTGQAQAFFNNVRFESGTLRDYQIDPFGRTIEFDEKLKRFQSPNCDSAQQAGAKSGSCPPQPSTAMNNNPCPQGEAKETKFYLLGPEGIKELDLTERLVMAMSTDAQPLVSALQRIAGIKAQAETGAAAQYQVRREQARLATAVELLEKARNALEKPEADVLPEDFTSPNALSTTIIDLFATTAPNGRRQ